MPDEEEEQAEIVAAELLRGGSGHLRYFISDEILANSHDNAAKHATQALKGQLASILGHAQVVSCEQTLGSYRDEHRYMTAITLDINSRQGISVIWPDPIVLTDAGMRL